MGRASERWELVNIGMSFGCYPKAKRAAQRVAAARKIPIMIRHLGPRTSLEDPTRVNHYILPNGEGSWKRDNGWYVDVPIES